MIRNRKGDGDNLSWRPLSSLKPGELEKTAIKIGVEAETNLDVGMCLVNISTDGFFGVLPGKLNFDGHHLCQFALQDSSQSYGMTEYNVAFGDPEEMCWKGWKPSDVGFPIKTLAMGWIKRSSSSSPGSGSGSALERHESDSFVSLGVCRGVVQNDPLVFIPGYLTLGLKSECIIEYFGKREPKEFQVLVDCH